MSSDTSARNRWRMPWTQRSVARQLQLRETIYRDIQALEEGSRPTGDLGAKEATFHADLALIQLASSERASRSLIRATWMLALATVVLAVATIVLAVRA